MTYLGMRVIAFIGIMVALPALAPALDLTCKVCLGKCCSWAYSAGDSPYYAYVRRTSTDPTPCVEVTAKYGYRSGKAQRCRDRAYGDCIARNCSRCDVTGFFGLPFFYQIKQLTKVPGHWGVSGNPPVRFERGQIIEIQRGREKEAAPTRGGGADNAASMRAVRQNDEIARSSPVRVNRK